MKKRIGIISPDIMGPIHNGGVGTSCALLGELLVRDGYEVDFVFADDSSEPSELQKWQKHYRKKGILLRTLPKVSFHHQHGHTWVLMSYRVYEFLKTETYDLVIFPDMFGLSYFSQIARQSGLMFHKMRFLVQFLGPQVWSKEANHELISHTTDMSLPMLERGAIETADHVQFATDWSVRWAREHKWKFSDFDKVLFPFLKVSEPLRPKRKPFSEIVFFGRLEYRKGLKHFLDAIEILHETGKLKGKTVTLLGREGTIDGKPALHYIGAWQNRTGIPLKIINDKQSSEAIAYLRRREALAVVASTSETMGYTLIECLSHGIPVICSDIEPFLEILGPLGTEGIFKSKNAKSLSQAIDTGKYFSGAAHADRLQKETDKKWLALVRKLAQPKTVEPLKTDPPQISVLMTHFNRAHYLREALQSLLQQTAMPREVLIYDDASSDRTHTKVIEEFRGSFKKVGVRLELVQGTENRGPGHGRNVLAQRARGEFLMFMDDDNLALPTEIASLQTIQRYTDADVVCPAMTKFYDGQVGLWQETRWTPVGFQLSANIFENLMGDTNFLIRKSTFEKTGGFEESKTLRAEDMAILVRAAIAGAKMIVCPEPLFHYRVHQSNRSISLEFHESRLHGLKNLFNNLTGQDMTAMTHLLLAWSYESGLQWGPEPQPQLRILSQNELNESIDLIEHVPAIVGERVQKFGTGWTLALGADRKITLDLSKIRKGKTALPKQCYLHLSIAMDNVGELEPSNGFQKLRFNEGLTFFTIAVENSAVENRLTFKTKAKVVFIAHARVIPLQGENVQ